MVPVHWRQLLPATADDLLDGVQFGDGCLRELTFRSNYGEGAQQSAVALLDVRRVGETRWVQLHIELSRLARWKVVDLGTFSWVLDDEPQLVQDEAGLLHLDLDNPGEERTVDEMAEHSHLYLAARQIRWAITDTG
ncbi:hypothetical protein ACTFTM_24405 [Micromonospora sp. RB23]